MNSAQLPSLRSRECCSWAYALKGLLDVYVLFSLRCRPLLMWRGCCSHLSGLHNRWSTDCRSTWWWGHRSNRRFQKPEKEWDPGQEREMSPSMCLSQSTSAALSLSKLSCSSWPGQKPVSSPEAFPAMIAVVLARVDKGPIRVLNGHPLSGHSYQWVRPGAKQQSSWRNLISTWQTVYWKLENGLVFFFFFLHTTLRRTWGLWNQCREQHSTILVEIKYNSE